MTETKASPPEMTPTLAKTAAGDFWWSAMAQMDVEKFIVKLTMNKRMDKSSVLFSATPLQRAWNAPKRSETTEATDATARL